MFGVLIVCSLISAALLLLTPVILAKPYLSLITRDDDVRNTIKEFKFRFLKGGDDIKVFFRRWRGLRITLVSLCITASTFVSLIFFLFIKDDSLVKVVVWLCVMLFGFFIYYQFLVDSLLTHKGYYKDTLFWSGGECIDTKLLRYMLGVSLVVGSIASFFTYFLLLTLVSLKSPGEILGQSLITFVTCFSVARAVTPFFYPISFHEYDSLSELLRKTKEFIDYFATLYDKKFDELEDEDERFWRNLELQATHETGDDELARCLFLPWRDSLKNLKNSRCV